MAYPVKAKYAGEDRAKTLCREEGGSVQTSNLVGPSLTDEEEAPAPTRSKPAHAKFDLKDPDALAAAQDRLKTLGLSSVKLSPSK